MIQRRRLVISGQVQGVFFRDSTRKTAQRAGATGWAANRPDGSVEVQVQGSRAAVDTVEEFCHSGPPQADVAEVQVAAMDLVENESCFSVR